MDYKEIISQVLKHEGGYVNDPTDMGGETNFGITKRWYPDLDIKNLTKDEVYHCYKEKDGGREIKSIRPIAWSSTKSGFGRGRVLAVVS